MSSNTNASGPVLARQLVSQKRVAVIIVNWNGWVECIECLDSLFGQDHPNLHVFVVDNDSQDRSVERLANWCDSPSPDPKWFRHPGVIRFTDRSDFESLPYRVVIRTDGEQFPPFGCRLTLVRSGGNLGFAGGCNVGIATAGLRNYDYFWFLNADAVVHRQALVELIGRAERQIDIGMVGSTVRYYDVPDRVQAMGGARLDRSNGDSKHIGEGASVNDIPADPSVVERELTYIMGASMLVSQKYITEIGPMEEDYFLYFEDADWGMRGLGKFMFGFAPNSHVFHKWGANSHKSASHVSSKYYYRNRLRFVSRFLPGRLGAARRAMFEQMLRHIARGRWTQARIVLFTLLASGGISFSVTQNR